MYDSYSCTLESRLNVWKVRNWSKIFKWESRQWWPRIITDRSIQRVPIEKCHRKINHFKIVLKKCLSLSFSFTQNLLNSGSHHLSFLFENKLISNDLTLSLPDELLTTTTSSPANATGLIDGELERRKFNELWSFYLFMFNLALVCSSIILQLLVGILLLLNTKASRKNPSMPRRSGECYNHLILVSALSICSRLSLSVFRNSRLIEIFSPLTRSLFCS